MSYNHDEKAEELAEKLAEILKELVVNQLSGELSEELESAYDTGREDGEDPDAEDVEEVRSQLQGRIDELELEVVAADNLNEPQVNAVSAITPSPNEKIQEICFHIEHIFDEYAEISQVTDYIKGKWDLFNQVGL